MRNPGAYQFTTLKRLFSPFHIENKEPLDGRANVRTLVYISRKKKNQREGNVSRASDSLGGEQITFADEPEPKNLERLRGIPSGDFVVMEHKSGREREEKGAENWQKVERELKETAGLSSAQQPLNLDVKTVIILEPFFT